MHNKKYGICCNNYCQNYILCFYYIKVDNLKKRVTID